MYSLFGQRGEIVREMKRELLTVSHQLSIECCCATARESGTVNTQGHDRLRLPLSRLALPVCSEGETVHRRDYFHPLHLSARQIY